MIKNRVNFLKKRFFLACFAVSFGAGAAKGDLAALPQGAPEKKRGPGFEVRGQLTPRHSAEEKPNLRSATVLHLKGGAIPEKRVNIPGRLPNNLRVSDAMPVKFSKPVPSHPFGHLPLRQMAQAPEVVAAMISALSPKDLEEITNMLLAYSKNEIHLLGRMAQADLQQKAFQQLHEQSSDKRSFLQKAWDNRWAHGASVAHLLLRAGLTYGGYKLIEKTNLGALGLMLAFFALESFFPNKGGENNDLGGLA